MKWTLEMEEEYADLKIMERLMAYKKMVHGSFDKELYIKNKKVNFQKVNVLNGKLTVYLPEGIKKLNNIGSAFTYPDNMGEYEEYIDEEGEYSYTFEKYVDTDCSTYENMEEFKYSVQDKYDTSIVNIQGEEIMNEKVTGKAVVYGEERMGYICQTEGFRIYVMCDNGEWQITEDLAKKIWEEAEIIKEEEYAG